jgi:phage gp45-like
MADRTLAGLVRLIDKRKAGDKATAETMIDLGEVSDVSGSAGEVPTCTVDGDDADVFEPYGLAGQAASGDALVFAPGGDSDSLTALLSSVAGRPATEPGDKALWSAAGHVVYLDDDGSLIITSKDGAVIELPDTGGVVVTAAPLAGITLVVDGGQIKFGDDTATLGVARQTDKVAADATMQTALALLWTAVNAMAAKFNVPGPMVGAPGTVVPVIPPSDFGVISTASTTTLSK